MIRIINKIAFMAFCISVLVYLDVIANAAFQQVDLLRDIWRMQALLLDQSRGGQFQRPPKQPDVEASTKGDERVLLAMILHDYLSIDPPSKTK